MARRPERLVVCNSDSRASFSLPNVDKITILNQPHTETRFNSAAIWGTDLPGKGDGRISVRGRLGFERCGAEVRDAGGTAPPSGLPAISPARGEIGCRARFR
ncbi:MAG: hypothetical protein E5X74_03655 [Mesorhizobium sp.]|nr:MAG: hypothetical protein E5X74_03655 [Mesorhizobium sp.]